MEREKQLELLEKLIQVHVKNSLFFNLQCTREELLAMGLDSLSKCLAKEVNPDRFIAKMELEAQMRVDDYSRIRAKMIVKDYDQKLIE